MKNIFFYASNNFFDNDIENLIYALIPLNIEERNPLITKKTFRKSLQKQINTAVDIDDIADICLDLVEPYLYLSTSILPTLDTNELINRMQLHEYCNNLLNQVFIKNRDYKQELKDIMVLSYIYQNSKNEIKISKNDTDIKKAKQFTKTTRFLKNDNRLLFYFYKMIINNAAIETADDIEDNRKIYDKICIFKRKSNNAFTETFFGKNPEMISIYDIELFLSLINHPAKNRNPFINHEDKLTNLKIFFKDLSAISLSGKKENTILHYMNENVTLADLQKLWTYNDYLLERITNMNFINSLYKFIDKNRFDLNHIQPLIQFIASPMLRTRLKLIEFIQLNTISSIENYPEWLIFIEKLFTHQIMCVLPISISVFYYLMMLRGKMVNTDKYFKNYLRRSTFFRYNEKDLVIEPQCFSIQKGTTNDKLYQKYIDNCYNKFIMLTAYYNDNNYDHNLVEVTKQWSNNLINILTTINVPRNTNNPYNIILAKEPITI